MCIYTEREQESATNKANGGEMLTANNNRWFWLKGMYAFLIQFLKLFFKSEIPPIPEEQGQ